MSKAQHTPGPWTCTPSHKSDYDYEVFTADGNILTYDLAQAEANARLIAAAPETAAERDKLREVNKELLEAVLQFIEDCDTPYGVNEAPTMATMNKARAAIARTKGE